MPDSAYKRCAKCGETKPQREFPRSRSHSDGLFSWCKPCKARDQRERNHRDDPGIVEREVAKAAQAEAFAAAAEVALCECGCGENPGVYSVTNHRTGTQPGRPRRFLPGHHRRGVAVSAETRAKITGRPPSPDAGSVAIHQWLAKHHPKAGRCVECGREGKTDYAFKHHPAPHTRDRSDYRELCRSCHFRSDELIIGRGAQLARSATSEQRRAAGRKGAAVRWGTHL